MTDKADPELARETPGPLDGIRVVELATVVAGPGAGRYLADYGAEVIKVEGPNGDPTRRMGWTGPDETDSYFWKLVNRNKQVVSLDLKTESGQRNLWSLLEGADVLIENMRPGKLEALGFGPDELQRRNPKMVVLRVTGFGQDGPYALHPGFATIAEAMSGFSNLLGEAGGQPLLPPVALTDEVTALVGAFATLAALRHAERTGEGQTIDVNLLTSMFQIMGPLPSAYAHMGYLQPRLGSGIPYTVPRGTYRCADGVWVAISSSADSIAKRVLALVGLGSDDRFSTFQGRSRNREALEVYVADWVASRPSQEVIREFRRVDAAIAKVLDMKDIFADEHYRARNMITQVDGVAMQNVVAGFSKTPGRVRHAGRPFDADTKAVLDRFAATSSKAES
ncbi:CoA transferase [Mesorhizobium sp. B3-1-6]|uniref:CaiB/BaiF CoA transferase family protein n=1 Tax=Mesorhizobium sp. B3-1-6 TaxID=2589895 RepID=UPI001127FB16|nr:CoA transferase [Mesorhizobium sp. B3-1-6]TPI44371.1 CoA transferase [Mesorhizobium sp. B3-1-6]